jgi:hypothetical protein
MRNRNKLPGAVHEWRLRKREKREKHEKRLQVGQVGTVYENAVSTVNPRHEPGSVERNLSPCPVGRHVGSATQPANVHELYTQFKKILTNEGWKRMTDTKALKSERNRAATY